MVIFSPACPIGFCNRTQSKVNGSQTQSSALFMFGIAEIQSNLTCPFFKGTEFGKKKKENYKYATVMLFKI